MDKLKERWEFIIGYVALIVSISAFKEELQVIYLNLGFFVTTASQFLFILILSFIFTMHLYLIPFLFSSTRYANIKLLKYLETLAYIIFVFLSISPLLVLTIALINYGVDTLKTAPPQTKETYATAISVIIGLVSGIISSVLAFKYRARKYLVEKQDLESQEIKEFESAQKLFDNSFYSQSILEAFKVLELHLRRLIIQKDIPFRSSKFQDILDVAFKIKVINKRDLIFINEIRYMRNSAAHLNVDFTKQQAKQAIDFIRELIKRTSNEQTNSAG